MVEHLINPVDCSWNVDLLNAYIRPDDVKIIRDLAISRCHKSDSYGWSLTESGKYSVKSGFRTESLYPYRGQQTISFGPSIKHLLVFFLGTEVPSKIEIFCVANFVWNITGVEEPQDTRDRL